MYVGQSADALQLKKKHANTQKLTQIKNTSSSIWQHMWSISETHWKYKQNNQIHKWATAQIRKNVQMQEMRSQSMQQWAETKKTASHVQSCWPLPKIKTQKFKIKAG